VPQVLTREHHPTYSKDIQTLIMSKPFNASSVYGFSVALRASQLIPLFLFASLAASVSPSYASGYAGTGFSKDALEGFCKLGALQEAAGSTSTRSYINTTLKGRFALGNSTAQQYRNQLQWFRDNCPAY
jgi:hypothetical protein